MNGKKIFWFGVVALVAYVIISGPGQAAGIAQGALTGLRHGAEHVVTFVSDVFGHQSHS